ncbi:hypothetical protein GCM10018771_05880 [Streptomyces cellulosae]|nr:hypothetical protein GCM10018771_05880 [Streptomyces cellulosae]
MRGPSSRRPPHQQALCDTKRLHAADVTVKRGPSGALESRTWTVPGDIATSTQSFPSPLLL